VQQIKPALQLAFSAHNNNYSYITYLLTLFTDVSFSVLHCMIKLVFFVIQHILK